MVNSREKDKKKREIVSSFYWKRVQYKYLIKNLSILKEKRFKAIYLLNNLPRNSSTIRLRNRCIISGRGRGVYRFCKLSRIVFREKALKGQLPGISKATW